MFPNSNYKKAPAEVTVGEPLKLVGVKQAQCDPYQIYIFVGGSNAISKTYTV